MSYQKKGLGFSGDNSQKIVNSIVSNSQ
jgi:hypothetical protein